ncbi:hypothetical protein A2U01_0059908, partial [Trifolium medium]|nr:hypothetical protein [Trifolium medium]
MHRLKMDLHRCISASGQLGTILSFSCTDSKVVCTGANLPVAPVQTLIAPVQ